MKSRIYELDAFRGIAAMAVVIFHFTMDTKFEFNFGALGVDFFFIISGFVILLSIEQTKTYQKFLINRFSRLFPTYWACLSITAIFMLAVIINSNNTGIISNLITQFAYNITMLQYYFIIKNIDAPYWTLIIELLFYLFILLIFIFNALKKIEIIGFIFISFSFLYSFNSINNNYYMFQIKSILPLINYFPLFFSGIIFYKLKTEKKYLYRFIILSLCFIVQLLIFKNCYYNTHFISIGSYSLGLTFIFIFFLLFIYNKISFFINHLTLWFGSISYSLYLIHKYIGTQILLPWFIKHLNINYWVSFSFALLIVIFLAGLITKFIEKPAMAFIRSKHNYT